VTVLVNEITIEAPRHEVWRVLSDLELLEQYDPGVRSSRLLTGSVDELSTDRPIGTQAVPAGGLGAARRCTLRPGGWFVERVTDWKPDTFLAFELVDCSLPVRRLRHEYTLTSVEEEPHSRPATVVRQIMTYELKYAALGRLLDTALMRRQWDRGVKAFLAGLRAHVLSGRSSPAAD
jgi:hypothetical protein